MFQESSAVLTSSSKAARPLPESGGRSQRPPVLRPPAGLRTLPLLLPRTSSFLRPLPSPTLLPPFPLCPAPPHPPTFSSSRPLLPSLPPTHPPIPSPTSSLPHPAPPPLLLPPCLQLPPTLPFPRLLSPPTSSFLRLLPPHPFPLLSPPPAPRAAGGSLVSASHTRLGRVWFPGSRPGIQTGKFAGSSSARAALGPGLSARHSHRGGWQRPPLVCSLSRRFCPSSSARINERQYFLF